MQVQLYSMGLKMVGEPVIKGSVTFLEDASTNKLEVGDAELQTAGATAGNYIDGIMNRDFTVCPGKFCGQCNYKFICRYRK